MIFRLGKLYVKLAEDIEKYGIFLCFTWNNPSRLYYIRDYSWAVVGIFINVNLLLRMGMVLFIGYFVCGIA